MVDNGSCLICIIFSLSKLSDNIISHLSSLITFETYNIIIIEILVLVMETSEQ